MRYGGEMKPVKRIARDRCCGVLVDVQEFFLAQVDKRRRARLKTNIGHFVRLLDYFRIPTVVTLERPVEHKGTLPREIARHLGAHAQTFEKDFFDLTRDKTIRDHLAGLKRRQVIVAGCETDVCVMQSCLGLIDLGYEVFEIDELIFSSARDTEAAVERMKAAGAVFTTYKSLFYELVEAVQGEPRTDKIFAKLGPFPDDLPDAAVD